MGGRCACAVLKKKVSFCDTHKKYKMVTNLKAMSFGLSGSRPAAQSIVDLGRPIWWCDIRHCVAISENFVPPESVCIDCQHSSKRFRLDLGRPK
jgi:hypothetical protein